MRYPRAGWPKKLPGDINLKAPQYALEKFAWKHQQGPGTHGIFYSTLLIEGGGFVSFGG